MLHSLAPRTRLCIAAAAATLPLLGTAQADYLWLQRDGANAATGRFGELGKTPQAVASLAEVRAPAPGGQDLPVALEVDRVGISASGTGDLRLTANRKTERVLNYYQAKFGRNENRPLNDLELVPTTPNGNTFRLMWKGKAVAAAQVNVDTSDGWQRVLKPAGDGTVTLDTPFPGLYVLEVTARVDGAATIDGKKYEDVRHTATLSFEVPRP